MSRHAERGHALVFVVALLAALGSALLLVHDSGRIATAKQRLLDTADAAALSGATWQARVLNFESYMNRAVIANEAATAQAVSLRSWLAYMERTVDRADRVARFVPYLAQASRVLGRLIGGVNRAAQPALMGAESVLAAYSTEFALAGEALHAAAVPAGTTLVREVIADQWPGAELSARGQAGLARNAAAWAALTQRYAGAQRARQRDLMLRSRDGFTANRGASLAPLGGLGLVRLEKRGGTDMLGYSAWRGLDSFALHTRDFFGWRETLSIGWGAAEQGALQRMRGWHGGSYRVNRRTSRTAERSMRVARVGRGVAVLRDIAHPARRAEPALALEFEIEVRGSNVPSAHRDLGLPRPGSDEVMTAATAARVFHGRTLPRADRRRELGSLYAPYWQARLAPVPLWLAP
jgi:hypothetical protein